jgi:hypothetical protein
MVIAGRLIELGHRLSRERMTTPPLTLSLRFITGRDRGG